MALGAASVVGVISLIAVVIGVLSPEGSSAHRAVMTPTRVVAPPVPSETKAATLMVSRRAVKRSRLVHRDLGARAAARLVSRTFAEVLASDSVDAKALIAKRGGARRYLNDHTAVPRTGRGMIVSTAPLRHRSASGRKVEIDTRLVRKGSRFATASTAVASTIGARLAGGIEAGTAPRVTVSGASVVARRMTDDKLMYANTAVDTDVITVAENVGVEVLTVLRSIRSPERQLWSVDVPEGGRVAANKGGGVDVLGAEGKPVSTISAPKAFDAVGRPVDASLEVVDGGRLALTADHRAAGVTYPVIVDPLIQPWLDANGNGWWYGGHSEGLESWQDSQDDANGSYWATRKTCYAPVSCYGAGQDGLYIYAMQGTRYAAGSSARWTYTLPTTRTTYFKSVEFKNMTFNKGGDTVATPYVAAGIQGTAGWTGVYNNLSGISNASVKVTANTGDLTKGKKAVVGLWNTLDRPTPVWEHLYVGGVVFELDDPEAPTLGSISGGSGGTAQTNWVRGIVTVNANASDAGLGVWQFIVSTPNKSGVQTQRNYSVGNCTGRVESPCPTTVAQNLDIDTNTMPDGVNAVSALVMDAGQRTAPWRGWNLKVDNTRPSVALTGSIAGSVDADVMPHGAMQALGVAATDAKSGVASISIALDGGTPQVTSQTCAATTDGCSLSTAFYKPTADLKAGRHTMRVDVVDRAGNHEIRDLAFYVYRTSWVYGGEDNHRTDTLAERQAVKAAINAALTQAAKDELRDGLVPQDRRLVDRLFDTTAPVITEINRPGYYIKDRSSGISFAAADEAGAGQLSTGIVDLRIRNMTAPSWPVAFSHMLVPACGNGSVDCPGAAHVVSAISNVMPEGVNVIQVEATDAAGNVAVKHYNVLVDSVAPDPHPAGGAWNAQNGILTDSSFAMSADDVDSGVASMALYDADTGLRFLTGQDRTCTVRCAPTGFGPYQKSFDPIALGWQTGRHTLQFSTWDVAGNEGKVRWEVDFYRTSWVYGGSDHAVNTPADVQAVLAAIAASGEDSTAAVALLAGLSPNDRVSVEAQLHPAEDPEPVQDPNILVPPDSGATAAGTFYCNWVGQQVGGLTRPRFPYVSSNNVYGAGSFQCEHGDSGRAVNMKVCIQLWTVRNDGRVMWNTIYCDDETWAGTIGPPGHTKTVYRPCTGGNAYRFYRVVAKMTVYTVHINALNPIETSTRTSPGDWLPCRAG